MGLQDSSLVANQKLGAICQAEGSPPGKPPGQPPKEEVARSPALKPRALRNKESVRKITKQMSEPKEGRKEKRERGGTDRLTTVA